MPKRIFALITAVFAFTVLLLQSNISYAFSIGPINIPPLRNVTIPSSLSQNSSATTQNVFDEVDKVYNNQTNKILPPLQDMATTMTGEESLISTYDVPVNNSDLRGMIKASQDLLQHVAADEQQYGLDSFVDVKSYVETSESSQFRTQLKTMVTNMQAIFTALLALQCVPQVGLPTQGAGMLKLIDELPPRFLFPVYVAMTQLGYLKPGVQQLIANVPSELAQLNPVCQMDCATTEVNQTLINQRANNLMWASQILNVMSTFFNSRSNMFIGSPVAVDIGVAFGVDGVFGIQENAVQALSVWLSFISNELMFVSQNDTQQVQSCNQQQILANQQGILTMLCKHNHYAPICAQYDTDNDGHHGEDHDGHHG